MQAIKKFRNISRLCSHPRAGSFYDRSIQSQPPCDVDSCGRTRHADSQLVRRLQSALVESDGSVHDPVRIRSIDFQRSVVRRDDSDAADLPEVLGNRDRKRCAFFRIGGGAEFI